MDRGTLTIAGLACLAGVCTCLQKAMVFDLQVSAGLHGSTCNFQVRNELTPVLSSNRAHLFGLASF